MANELENQMAAAAAEEITLTLGETPATPATPKVEERSPNPSP